MFDLDESCWQRLRTFYLDEMDAWQSGQKATVGQAATNLNGGYQWAMRGTMAELEQKLRAMGAWGNSDWSQRHACMEPHP